MFTLDSTFSWNRHLIRVQKNCHSFDSPLVFVYKRQQIRNQRKMYVKCIRCARCLPILIYFIFFSPLLIAFIRFDKKKTFSASAFVLFYIQSIRILFRIYSYLLLTRAHKPWVRVWLPTNSRNEFDYPRIRGLGSINSIGRKVAT